MMAGAWPALGLSLAMVLLGTATVRAHGILERAEPRVGSQVRAAPAQVRLWFTGGLEPAFSSAQVVDEAGRRVDKADAQVDASNRALLRVSLPPLGAGTYRVIWRVLSIDGHVTQGEFSFRVTE
jgi:hypothetical protein